MSPSADTEPGSGAERGAGRRPRAGIILVQPQTASYVCLVWEVLRRRKGAVKALFGKANSDMIAGADRGPFSHSVLYSGERIVDSRSSGRRHAIAVSPIQDAEKSGRAMSFYRFEPPGDHPVDGDAAAAAAFQAVLDYLGLVPAETGTKLPDEPNLFPVAAMVNVGLILVSSQRRGLRWLGRLLTRYTEDAAGMYCAELVAKAMIAANAPFVVEVDASRIPPENTTDEDAVHEGLQQRLGVWDSLPIGGQAAGTTQVQYPRERLRSLRRSLLEESGPVASTTCHRQVGFGEGEFPPSLVSPNDLARSPSFVWSVNHQEPEPIEDCEPELDRPASLARVLILGLVVLITRWLMHREGSRTREPDCDPGPVT